MKLLTKGTTMTPMELVIVQINNLVEAKEKGRMTQSEWDMQLVSVVAEYKVAVLNQAK
jgi:hypothetical protein